jgi:Na+/proline symporter
VLAGILAAAMSTLSSSLNALAGSTLIDLMERFGAQRPDPASALRMSRILTLVWAVVFMGFAMLFEGTDNPVVELGLGIAGFTYGGLLGAFLLGLMNRRAVQSDAIVAFLLTVAAMTALIFGLWWSAEQGAWVVAWRPDAEARSADGLAAVAWPLYPLIGALLTVGLGSLFSLRHRSADGS